MIAIDTQVLIWWVASPEKLSKKALKSINGEVESGQLLLVSAICVWEIYMLVQKGRLKLSMDIDAWLEKIEKLPYFQFVPVDNKIASKSVTLPEPFHADPADRIIVATAREFGAVLVSSDRRLLNYKYVQSLW